MSERNEENELEKNTLPREELIKNENKSPVPKNPSPNTLLFAGHIMTKYCNKRKGCWKDHEVGKFLAEENFPT